MKKILILLVMLTLGNLTLMAQAPPAPPSTGSDGGKNGFVGGSEGPGAPIGNGTYILLVLAAAYTSRKVYVMRTITVK